MSPPYQVEKMIPEGVVLEVGRKKEGNIQQYAFSFTSSACAHQYTLAQMHRGDAELLPVDKQMTDKWLVGTPPPGSIVIALWDCANGISYREGAREQGPCVILHKQNLCQPPDVIASTAVNCGQSNRSVNLGYRERGHGLRGEEKWNRKEWKKGEFLALARGFDPKATPACSDKYC